MRLFWVMPVRDHGLIRLDYRGVLVPFTRETGAMMNRVTGMLLGAVCVAITPGLGGAQDKQADDYKADVLALASRIDGHINKGLKEAEVSASPKASDHAYFRRLNLDLAGRIPDLLDIGDFIDDTRPEKRWI